MKSTRYENENLDLYVRRSRSVASKKAWKSFLIPLQYQHHFPYTYSYLRSWIIAFKTTRLAEMEEEQKMKNTREKLQVTKRLFCTWLCKLETLIRVEIFPLHSLIHTFNSRVLHFFSLLRWFQFFLVFLLLSPFTFLLPSTTQKKKNTWQRGKKLRTSCESWLDSSLVVSSYNTKYKRILSLRRLLSCAWDLNDIKAVVNP